jgi:hypothetical protein
MYAITGKLVQQVADAANAPAKSVVVSSAKDLEALPLTQLADLYNASAPAKPIKRFRNRTDAAKRVWAIMETLVGRSHGARTRQSRFAGKRLYSKVKVNPRNPGHSNKLFQLIMDNPGITFEEWRAAGGKLVDISHDYRNGRLEAK